MIIVINNCRYLHIVAPHFSFLRQNSHKLGYSLPCIVDLQLNILLYWNHSIPITLECPS